MKKLFQEEFDSLGGDRLTNVQDVLLHNCRPFKGTKIFVEISGAASKNIKLGNNELGDAIVIYGDEAMQ